MYNSGEEMEGIVVIDYIFPNNCLQIPMISFDNIHMWKSQWPHFRGEEEV